MPSVLHTASDSGGGSYGASVTHYAGINNPGPNETNPNRKLFAVPSLRGFIRYVECIVTANTNAASTVTLMRLIPQGTSVEVTPLAVSITGSTTGTFTASGAVRMDGSGGNLRVQTGAGGTTTIPQMNMLASYESPFYIYSMNNGSSRSFGTTYYHPVVTTSASDTSETAALQPKVRSAGTLSTLLACVTTNSNNGTSTITLRKNSTNTSVTVSIPTSSTGVFSDRVNTASVSSGDVINYTEVTGGTTGNLLVSTIQTAFTSTDGSYTVVNADGNPAAVNTSLTRYAAQGCHLGSSQWNSTESFVTTTAQLGGVYSNLTCYLSTNSISATSTLRTRVSAANGNQSISITASTTGEFTDSTNTDSVTPSSTFNYQIVTGASGSQVIVDWITTKFVPLASLTLSDNYDDNTIGSDWTDSVSGSATVNETNKRLEMALPSSATSSDYASRRTVNRYDFSFSSVSVEIVQAVSSSTAANQDMAVYVDSTHYIRTVIEGGTIFYQYRNGGGNVTVLSESFNSTTMRWWRIVEDGGNVYWQVAESYGKWNTRAAAAPNMNYTAAYLYLETYAYQNETNPGTGIYDNFNFSPSYGTTAWFRA